MAKAFSILFSDRYDDSSENAIAACRTLASEPFSGRYRLIDFILSSLVNSGIYRVGIVTKDRYGSLIDHVGWGKDWDLNRREGGLQILTPFIRENMNRHVNSAVDALISARAYISDAKEDLVILATANIVANIDFSDAIQAHLDHGADITAFYRRGRELERRPLPISLSEDGRVKESADGYTDYTPLNVFIMRKELLLQLLDEAEVYRWTDIRRDFVIRNLHRLNVYAYEQPGFCRTIKSVEDYYKVSMELLNLDVRHELFFGERPILTRVKNSAPTYYGYESKVENSLVADGCVIEGCLKNCIVFRDVTVEKGARLEDCILMQGTKVGKDARLSCVITDKNVTVGANRILSGYTSYPFVVAKNASV